MSGVAVAGGIVPFDDAVENLSPEIDVTAEGQTHVRPGFINAANEAALIAECFPNPPDVRGVHPSNSLLRVKHLKLKGWGKYTGFSGNGFPIYEKLLATITYGPVNESKEDTGNGEVLLTRNWRIAGEFITLPKSALKWSGEDNPLSVADVTAAQVIPITTHVVKLHQAPSPRLAVVRDNIGKVNESDFEGADPETLLYSGCEISFVFRSDGTTTYDHEHHFDERRVVDGDSVRGWNYFLDPVSGEWKELVRVDNDKPIYEKSSDFQKLLRYS